MIVFFACLILITGLLGLAFKLTGALLKACLWLFIFVPVSIVLFVVGLVCCCTLLFIPVGIALLKQGARLIIPG